MLLGAAYSASSQHTLTSSPCLTGCPVEKLGPRHLENDFQLDHGAERKACDATYQAARILLFCEDLLQQLQSGVSDFHLFADFSRSANATLSRTIRVTLSRATPPLIRYSCLRC
jgi:hypothetical protein